MYVLNTCSAAIVHPLSPLFTHSFFWGSFGLPGSYPTLHGATAFPLKIRLLLLASVCKQSHGIYHCSWDKIFSFLQFTDFRSSDRFQTSHSPICILPGLSAEWIEALNLSHDQPNFLMDLCLNTNARVDSFGKVFVLNNTKECSPLIHYSHHQTTCGSTPTVKTYRGVTPQAASFFNESWQFR